MTSTGPYFMPNGDCIVPAGAALAARVSFRSSRDGADLDITGRLFAMTVFNTATGAVVKSARMTAVGTSALLLLDGDDTNDLRTTFLTTALTIMISEILNSGYLRISEGVLEVTAGPVLPPQTGDDPSLQATNVIYVGDGSPSSTPSVIYVATGAPGLSAAQLLYSAGKIDMPTIEALDAYLRQQGIDAVTPLTERAEAAADAAEGYAGATGADRVQTGLDRIQTGLDRASAANSAEQALAIINGGGSGINLLDNSASIALAGLDIVRHSNGPTATITNDNRSNVFEFRQSGTGHPTTRVRVGGYSDEANLGFNMNYDNGNHRYDDPTRFAVWLAANGNGFTVQSAPPGYVGSDMWYGTGSGNLLSFNNIGTGGANIFTGYVPGQFRFACGNDLSGGKNYLDAGVMRLTESTGVQTLDFSRTLSGATIQTNGYSGTDTNLVLKCYSVPNQIKLWAGPPGEVEFGCGVTSGGPTGGNKGNGTSNWKAVYDDGLQLTGYALDAGIAMLEGNDPAAAIDVAKYDLIVMGEHFGARMFLEKIKGGFNPLDLEAYADHWKTKRHLSAMPNEEKIDPVLGISNGELLQRLWETAETQAVHDYQLLTMIKALAARVDDLSAQLAARGPQLPPPQIIDHEGSQ